MELLDGETLGQLVRREAFLPPSIAAELVDQLLDALEAAHSSRIIHRDLKPENIFLNFNKSGACHLKILDFGLAKLMHPEAESKGIGGFSMTSPGMVLGTLGYMSPEQLIGATIDERSDLFSVGVIAVEVLTGQRPFSGRTTHELLTAILNQPSSIVYNLTTDGTLDRVLRKCLEKNPDQRFSSASEMRHELIPAIRRYSLVVDVSPIDLETRPTLVKIPRSQLSDNRNPLSTTLAR
jgi:serine/threonine-protein kinase